MKDVFKEKYLEYEPKITLEIFTLVWNRLIELCYKSFNNATIEKRYDEFKGRHNNYFRTTEAHPNEFNCYNNGNPYSKTTVEEILGYNPFIKENKSSKDWNSATDEELLEEAKRRYPIGCKIKLIGHNRGGDFGNEVRFTKYKFFGNSIRKQLYVDYNLLIFDGAWAEIETIPEVETKIDVKEALDAQNKQINSKPIEKCCRSFQIGQTVYHRNVYEHKEPLKIVGILEDKLLLEGDFSGGTHNVIQRDWLPIKGTSTIYNHAFKLDARKAAKDIETLAIPCAGCQDNTFKELMLMTHYVMVLTNDVSLNPECE